MPRSLRRGVFPESLVFRWTAGYQKVLPAGGTTPDGLRSAGGGGQTCPAAKSRPPVRRVLPSGRIQPRGLRIGHGTKQTFFLCFTFVAEPSDTGPNVTRWLNPFA